MILGDLEKLVLNYLWDNSSADAKQVHAHFEKQRGGTLNTIQSTLDRLHKKGLLTREKHGHAYQYRAAMDRQTFVGALIREVTHDFADDNDALLAAFVTLSAERDDKQLARLESLIQTYREQHKDSK